MSFLGVHLCAQAPQGLRFCGGEVALAGFAFAGSFFMVQAAAVGFLKTSIFIALSVFEGEVSGSWRWWTYSIYLLKRHVSNGFSKYNT